MKQIEIDAEVLEQLSKQAVGFNVTPNDVLRKLLGLDIYSDMSKEPTISTSLLGFIHSKEFEAHSQAIDRYLNILSWLNTHHEEKFPNVILNFQRGGRRYFADTEDDILRADGVSAKPIPRSSFWALATLDNKTKRLILEDILGLLGYQNHEVSEIVAKIPDSTIRRNRSGKSSKLIENYLQKFSTPDHPLSD